MRSFFSSFAVPGGVLVVCAVLALRFHVAPLPPAPVLEFCVFALAAAGLLLAWRFNSTRSFLALTLIILAQWGLRSFVGTPAAHVGFTTIAFLLPLNFLLLAWFVEPGFTLSTVAAGVVPIFVQATAVAVICRPDDIQGPAWLDRAPLPASLTSWSHVPQLPLLAFVAALIMTLLRFALDRKPLEGGLFWSVMACLLAVRARGVGAAAGAFLLTAVLVLVVCLVETSYRMAYHDELTGLPGRRAFNDAVRQLKQRYALAIVDVDHFKKFNDTYGHDTGDQVLKMVASRLAEVTGGGEAFRCGGEEFAIVFPHRSAADAALHLERLRQSIEYSVFTVRGPDRSQRERPERRYNKPSGKTLRTDVTVTVSIGVAEPTQALPSIEHVLHSADQALYRAKDAGRNRVEVWTPRPRRVTARDVETVWLR